MVTIEKNARQFVDVDLPSSGFIITEDSFKRFTLSVIADYAFSGSVDKKWMETALQSVTSRLQLQFFLTQFLGDIARYLPTPFNICLVLVRRQMSLFLARRRALLRRSGVTLAAVRRVVGEPETDNAAASAAAAAFAAAAAVPGGDAAAAAAAPPLSIDLGLSLADQLLLAGYLTLLAS